MSCKLDVKKGILNDVWQNFGENRATFSRVADDIIQVNAKSQVGGKAQNRKQAFRIAENFLDRVKKRYRSHVNGYISEVDDFTPITINLSVSDGYIDYEYRKLPAQKQTDPNEPRNIAFFKGDFALLEQEKKDFSDDDVEENPQLFGLEDTENVTLQYGKSELEEELYYEIGIGKYDTPLDFIDKYSPEKEKIETFLKANKGLSLMFDNDGVSGFDPVDNKIYISLFQADSMAHRTELSLAQTVNIIIEHEMAHAASVYALQKPENARFVGELLDIAREYNKKTPFQDGLRQNQVNILGHPYSLSNIQEFVADAFSNPFFQEYLKTVPYKKTPGSNLWDIIVDFFRNLLGFSSKDNLYDKVVNFINSEKIRIDNLEESLIPQAAGNILFEKGSPKNYLDATYEHFTTPHIAAQIEDVFKKLPAGIIKLKRSLSEETNSQDRKRIQSLLDAYNEVKGKKEVVSTYINMLTTAAEVVKDLEKQLLAASSLVDPEKKIHVLYSVFLSSKNLSFLTPIVGEIINILEINGVDASIKPFVTQLRGILSIENKAKRDFIEFSAPAVLSYWSSTGEDSQALKQLNAQYTEIKKKLDDPKITDSNRKYYTRQLEKVRKDMTRIPSSETFKSIFSGKYEDASALQMNLEALAVNSHPLVSSVFSRLRELDIAVSQAMIAEENKHQIAEDKIIKSNGLGVRNIDKTWEPIRDTIDFPTEVTEEEDGTIKYTYTPTKMLLPSYSPKYLQEILQFQRLRDFYYDKFLEGKRDNKQDVEDKYYRLYQTTIENQQKFQRENSELRYTDPVYDMFDLLDKKIDKDGVQTSFRKERGDIFTEIENLEHRRDSSTTLEDQRGWQEEITRKYIQLREIRSPYDSLGREKGGFELELSNIANEYYRLKNEYGQYIITPEGLASFEREIAELKDKLDKGLINQDQYDATYNSMTVTELEQAYFDELDRMTGLVAEATEKLMVVPEIAAALKNVNRDKVREGYKKIRQLTSAFRDNNGIIDGILFSKVKPELVKEIKDIQQEIENLKNEASKLKGLSVTDTILLDSLVKKNIDNTITPEERVKLDQLREEVKSKDALYKANKVLIDGFYEMIAALSNLTESSVSEYYDEEVSNQTNILIAEEKKKVERDIMRSSSIEGGKYYKNSDGNWFKLEQVIQATGERIVTQIKDEDGYSATQKVIDEVALTRAKAKLPNSEWWRNNHITAYKWDWDTFTYTEVERPIYIWVRTEPRNKEFIKAGQPSLKFKTYKIHDGTLDPTKNYINPNFKEIFPYVPINKSHKFRNDKYDALTNSKDKKDINMKEYLEFLRTDYQKSQEVLPDNKKMGDILPSIHKTTDELKVEWTNSLLKLQTYQNLFGTIAKTDKSEDSALLLGGSQSKYYSSRRIIPARFTNVLNAETQSSNLPAMILTFNLAMKKYVAQTEIQPLLETTRIIVENLGVEETSNMAAKFSLRGIWAAIKSDTKKVTRGKEVDQSNLSKTMDYMLETFLYEERKDPTIVNIAGMNLDVQKVSANLKQLSSLSIFSLNSFLAVKNTISAKVQTAINANISKGFYTYNDYLRAEVDAAGYVKDFVMDYKKFGNKSFIGQAIQYFQVLQGTSYNEYGRKTQWTAIKDAANFLTMFKNISEFELQVAQFLAMSRANKVTVNGKPVPMIEAFELKNGNFQLKQGAVLSQKDVNKFIQKLSWINRNINGAYRQEERNKLQKSVLGDLAFYLNGYVMPGITNRFAGSRFSNEADLITRGYYNQFFSFALDLVKYRTSLNEQWENLTMEEKNRVLRFLKELGFIVAFMFLVGALGGGDDKDELRKNSPLQNYLLALAMSVKSETETFAPLPSMGLNEMSRKLNSPFAALRQISNIIRTLDHGWDFIMGNDSGFYKTTGVKDGFHDKGDPKVVADFLKLVGYTGVQFNPLERVVRVERIQQLR